MRRFFIFLFLGLMFLGFVSGVNNGDKIKMIVEPNENYISYESLANINRYVNGNKYGVFDLTKEEINELKKDKSLIIRKPYKLRAFLGDAITQQDIGLTWSLQLNEINITGSQQSVCVIDSGVDLNHSDLEDKILAQHCFCASSNCCPDGTSEDDNATDDNGHGTHVAGIIAANGGINGVGIGANLVIVKALNSSGNGNEADLIDSIDWCVTNSEEYNITVISASLGADCDLQPELCYSEVCSGLSNTLQTKIQNAMNKNISVVIATGNEENTTHISWPSCLPNVIRVASIDKDDSTISTFSNRNSLVKLLGVGRNVNSTMPTHSVYLNSWYSQTYSKMSGTSMATPMVAGAIAILNQYLNLSEQTKTPAEIEDILYDTGKTISEDSINYSRIDVYSAILSLDVDNPNVTLVLPTDNHINLSVNQTFTCNATDWQLANVTFKIWNSTGLYNETTVNLTGTSNETSLSLIDMPETTYYWNCFFSDAEGNTGNASNYTLTIGGAEVDLVSPENDSYTNINETNFTCNSTSDSNYELSNVTFYLWNSSADLVYNLSEDISGFSNQSIFNYTFSVEDNYTWGCLALNNNSNNNSLNYTITYDVTMPNISAVSTVSIAQTTATITWTTNEDSNSSVYVSGGSWKNSSSYTTSHSISISSLSASTTYTYFVTSCDRAENCNSSSESSFTTSAIVASSSGGGGGSSGGGSGGKPIVGTETNPIPTESLDGDGYQAKYSLKQSKYFKDKSNNTHSLTLDNIVGEIAVITIRSEPQIVYLLKNQSHKFNLTSSDYYDLEIVVDDIVFNSAEITIKSINEAIPRENILHTLDENSIKNETSDEIIVDDDRNFGIIIVSVSVLIIVVIIVIIVNRKRLKGSETNNNNGKSKKTKT